MWQCTLGPARVFAPYSCPVHACCPLAAQPLQPLQSFVVLQSVLGGMTAVGHRLDLERSLDSISRGVVSLERFPASSDFSLCIALEGFALACPHCGFRLGDFRALLREIAATDRLHPPVLSRIIQEVEQGTQETFVYCSLPASLFASRLISFTYKDIKEGLLFQLPPTRVVSGLPQPADFSVANNCSRPQQRKAISYLHNIVTQPTEAAAFSVTDPDDTASSGKRAKAYRDLSEAFKSSLRTFHIATAHGIWSSVQFNQQIQSEQSMEEAEAAPSTSQSGTAADAYVARVIDTGSSRPYEALDGSDLRFRQESDSSKQRRLRLIHAVQALTAELVLYPGMTSQLVVQVARVSDPTPAEQAIFEKGLEQ